MSFHRTIRPLVAALSALCLVGLGNIALPASRPQAPANSATTIATTDLLRSAPFDRITLTDNTVLVVEPVSPRPLPPLDQARARRNEKVRVKGSNVEIPLEGNIGLPGEASRFKPAEKGRASDNPDDEAERKIKIHLLEQADVRDFEVKRSNIRKIEYFEDILLDEGDRLILGRNYTAAFECFLWVKIRNPGWPGLDAHIDRLLFSEGSAALVGGDNERGVRLLRELLERRRDYPGLLDKLSSAYAGWITRAIELGEYAKGRRFLHDLEGIAPEHVVVRNLRERFVALANRRVKEGASGDEFRRLDAIVDALRIWPALDGGESLFGQAFSAVPTLDVAVNDVPRPLGPWLHAPADLRVSRLLYLPILASDGDDARQGRAPGQLAAAVEASDLGRRLMIRLRAGIPWSDGSRQVTAADVARCLIDRSDPGSPRYQARWAEILDQVASPDDARVEVRLKRPLLRLASWLGWPFGPAHAGVDGRAATVGGDRILVGNGPFECRSSSEKEIELVAGAASSSAEATPPPRVRRIREVRYSGAKAAVEALLRGDVSLAAHVPSNQVAVAAANPDVKVGRYNQPAIHLIALDGRNRALKNRAFRRGLSYAIDRRTLLEERILGRPVDAVNIVSDGPMPKGSYADASGVKPLEYNTTLATMLIAAAHKELGGTAIELKLEYPAIPEALAVVPSIVEAIRAAGAPVGLKIEATEWPESQLESALRAGRRFDLAYRVLRCDEPILEAGPLLCPGYDSPPETDALASAASTRILQLLLQLERASELASARGLAQQIDRESRDELPILPLWQVEDHYAWRTRLKGPADAADQIYQGIATWEIAPWIARDAWAAK